MSEIDNIIKKNIKDAKLTYSVNVLDTYINNTTELLSFFNLIKNQQGALTLYTIKNLGFVWKSYNVLFGYTKESSVYYFSKLVGLGLIEPFVPNDSSKKYLEDVLERKKRDIVKMEFYRLTKKGKEFLKINKIYESLCLLIDKDIKEQVLNDKKNRLRYYEDEFL